MESLREDNSIRIDGRTSEPHSSIYDLLTLEYINKMWNNKSPA